MRAQLLPALRVLLVLTVLTGVAYPLVVTGVGQLAFPDAANGSIVERDGELVGSRLVAQEFTADRYFHSRPSVTGYDPLATAGSNLGPTNPDLVAAIEERAEQYRDVNGLPPDAEIPVDAVTASASGIDPDISVANARLQAPRVAEARGLDADTVLDLVAQHTAAPTFGVLGERRVDVLALNLALDEQG